MCHPINQKQAAIDGCFPSYGNSGDTSYSITYCPHLLHRSLIARQSGADRKLLVGWVGGLEKARSANKSNLSQIPHK